MAGANSAKEKSNRGVSWRAVAIGVILIPFIALWVQSAELLWKSAWPDAASLLFNAVIVLLLIGLANLVLRKWLPHWALTPGELVVIYAMMCLATAICGHDFLQVLVIMLTTSAYYATPGNQWQKLFSEQLPSSVVVTEPTAVQRFWEGGGYLYSWESLHPWIAPAAAWIGFTVVLVSVMICINLIVLRRWNDQERLSYPLLEIPLGLSQPGFGLLGKDMLGSRLLWIGFAIVAAIDLLNGFAQLYPGLPSLHLRTTLIQPTTFPWRAMDRIFIGLYPFAIGLGYMMPKDFLFSCWFFYWFWKAQLVLGYFTGQIGNTTFPYVEEQMFGAYVGIGLFTLWTGRGYFSRLIGGLLHGRREGEKSSQSFHYEIAFGGVIVGLIIVAIFITNLMGVSFSSALMFMGGYLLLSFSITRMRAEFGLPVHDFWTGPLRVGVNIAGARAFGRRNLTGLVPLSWLVRSQRSHPMPHTLEGLTLGERRGVPTWPMAQVLVLTVIVSTIVGFWSMLHLGYTYGFTINQASDALYLGTDGFQRTQNWLTFPFPADWQRLGGLLGGAFFVMALQVLRQRLIWWPFHPAGYAATSMVYMGFLWLPMMIAWAIKGLVLRYAGHKVYERLLPFFLGIILGQFAVGLLWAVVGTIGKFAPYRFWP